jgi:hypothetical protein
VSKNMRQFDYFPFYMTWKHDVLPWRMQYCKYLRAKYKGEVLKPTRDELGQVECYTIMNSAMYTSIVNLQKSVILIFRSDRRNFGVYSK